MLDVSSHADKGAARTLPRVPVRLSRRAVARAGPGRFQVRTGAPAGAWSVGSPCRLAAYCSSVRIRTRSCTLVVPGARPRSCRCRPVGEQFAGLVGPSGCGVHDHPAAGGSCGVHDPAAGGAVGRAGRATGLHRGGGADERGRTEVALAAQPAEQTGRPLGFADGEFADELGEAGVPLGAPAARSGAERAGPSCARAGRAAPWQYGKGRVPEIRRRRRTQSDALPD